MNSIRLCNGYLSFQFTFVILTAIKRVAIEHGHLHFLTNGCKAWGPLPGGAGGAAAPPDFGGKFFNTFRPPPRFWRVL